ncbi:MAG: response regulator [Rickettsiales bacterium]|nr:response regulator [Rickettsiales bacterium]
MAKTSAFRILLAEDSDEKRDRIVAACKELFRDTLISPDIQRVKSTAEGAKLLAQAPFDLLITDMEMEHRLAGAELIKAARASAKNSHVFIIGQSSDAAHGRNMMDAGANDFVAMTQKRDYDPAAALKSAISACVASMLKQGGFSARVGGNPLDGSATPTRL